MPSLVACPVGFAAPEGYRLANPSIALYGGRIVLLQPALEQRHPRRTWHFQLQLSEDLAVQSSAAVLVPSETSEASSRIRGSSPSRWKVQPISNP